jgi:hypothetical protein
VLLLLLLLLSSSLSVCALRSHRIVSLSFRCQHDHTTLAEHWRISRLIQLAGLTRDGKPAHVQRICPWCRRRRVLNSTVCDAAVSLPDMLQWVGSAVVQRVANRPMRTWMSIFDHQARCAIHHPSPIAHLPYHQRHNTNTTSRLIKSKSIPNMQMQHIHQVPTSLLNPPPRALAPSSSCSKSKVPNTHKLPSLEQIKVGARMTRILLATYLFIARSPHSLTSDICPGACARPRLHCLLICPRHHPHVDTCPGKTGKAHIGN